MHKSIFIVLLIFFSYTSNADIYWANKVVDFSSQKSDLNWCVNNILGKPNLFPQGGKCVSAWTSKGAKSKSEYIVIEFPNKIEIKQILVFESYNPGAISTIQIYDGNDKAQIVYNTIPSPYKKSKRILSIKLPNNKIVSNKVKIVLKNDVVWGHNYIDAVGIADDDKDYSPKINLPDNLEFKSSRNMGSNINTERSDRYPIVSADGKTLFFTRTHYISTNGKNKNTDIYVSYLKNNVWTIAKNIGKPLNNDKSNYVISTSPDGNTVYLAGNYIKGSSNNKGISYSYKKGKSWTYPQRMLIKNFEYTGKFIEYFVSANRNILLIASKHKDSHGNKDLYYSTLLNDSVWSEPINLGTDLNTTGIESYPYLASDNKTLYFTSDGHPGYGEADIYFSKRIDTTWNNWTTPINLGIPFNSLGWDGGISIPYKANKAYIVSNRSGLGREDIFEIDLENAISPEDSILLFGEVKSELDNKDLFAEVIYSDLSTGKNIGSVFTSNGGKYEIILNRGHKYSIRAESSGHYGINETIDLRMYEQQQKLFLGNQSKNEKPNKISSEIRKDLNLKPIKENITFRINNIFFETGKAELLNESSFELNRILSLLQENENFIIEITGHTDNVGHPQKNLILSINRANAVKEYFVNGGIQNNRIIAKGLGPEKPIVSNESKNGRALNRRVEFRIIEM